MVNSARGMVSGDDEDGEEGEVMVLIRREVSGYRS